MRVRPCLGRDALLVAVHVVVVLCVCLVVSCFVVFFVMIVISDG